MERILETLKRTAAALSRFRLSEEGSYMVYVGIAAIPMVTMAGLGVDVARAYLAEARLQSAIDAAAIAMGSADGTTPEIETLGRTYFYANFPADFWARPTNLQITVKRVDEEDNTSRPESFEISASAEVDTLFFRLLPFGLSDSGTATATTHYDSISVAARSTAVTEVKGLEVVMVLDVTGSMHNDDNSGTRRIEAMRDAALDMVDILFGEQYEPELLRIGIVPYNTVVNIGRNMHGFVDDTGLDGSGNVTTPNPFGQTEWFGCVQARDNGHDLTDAYNATATDGSGKWYAYRWPIEPDRYRSSGRTLDTQCQTIANNSTGDYRYYEDPLTDFETADPDSWQIYTSNTPEGLQWVPSGSEREYDRGSDGPNKGCPMPLLPLTNIRADVWNYLQDITVVDRNGTVTATGLAWGWRVISPGPPFSEGKQYDDIDWEKAIIVLTDGQQVLIDQHEDCERGTKVTNPITEQPPDYIPWRFDPDDYNLPGVAINRGPRFNWSAYGYADPSDSRPLGTGTITTLFENRLRDVCTAIKAVEDPINGGSAIDIFAITFGGGITEGSTIGTMMKNCTTDPLNNYFHAPNTAKLKEAFEEIARQLTSLRLTE